MSGENLNKKTSRGHSRVLTIILGTVIFILVALWWHNRHNTVDAKSATITPFETAETQMPVSEGASEEINVPDKEEMLAQLVEAEKAVPDARPVQSTISERPEFVSEFEWELLQEAVRQDTGKNMSVLVNKLLFFKKYELWDSLKSSNDDVTTRQALAKEVLDMIPDQMEVLGQEQAQEMTQELSAEINNIS